MLMISLGLGVLVKSWYEQITPTLFSLAVVIISERSFSLVDSSISMNAGFDSILERSRDSRNSSSAAKEPPFSLLRLVTIKGNCDFDIILKRSSRLILLKK